MHAYKRKRSSNEAQPRATRAHAAREDFWVSPAGPSPQPRELPKEKGEKGGPWAHFFSSTELHRED